MVLIVLIGRHAAILKRDRNGSTPIGHDSLQRHLDSCYLNHN